VDLATAVLPVAFARAAPALLDALRATEPEIVVCFGQADGRTGISVERFAHNLDSDEPVDEDGARSGALIDPDGPVAYASTLRVADMVAALRAEGIPASESRDAGGFLCNHVFYVLMQALEDLQGARGVAPDRTWPGALARTMSVPPGPSTRGVAPDRTRPGALARTMSVPPGPSTRGVAPDQTQAGALARTMSVPPGQSPPGGFVHVPLLPEQALDTKLPSMPLETLVRGARVALAAAAV
jgi:pyrrolidone-carboxylate peptidase